MRTILILLSLLAASPGSSLLAQEFAPPPDPKVPRHVCDPLDGGLELPDGFCATVAADDLGIVRHIAVRENGDLYARLRSPREGKTIFALRDSNGDGKMDRMEGFFDEPGTGIGIWRGYLYFSTPEAIYRRKLVPNQLLPAGEIETVVSGFPPQRQHAAKTFAISEKGDLFVNIGAPSNACQKRSRTKGSPGLDPCPQLERQAGIWRFEAARTGQIMTDGSRFATGIRNAVAIAWHPLEEQVYVVQHGRDQLHQLWPEHFTVEESAELPAEELLRVDKGDDFGWPYCYYDQRKKKKVLAPEYGGDGEKVGRCAEFEDPVAAFPGHWAPNGLLFYIGGQFPQSYHGGAFVAFHGSWNRAPLPQQGYKVVFVPFKEESLAGDWFDFATGFAGKGPIEHTGDARYRPMGLAQAPDGSLYISDTVEGRIWRIWYPGKEAD